MTATLERPHKRLGRAAAPAEPGAPGDRLPAARRRRRPASAVTGALLLIVCVVVGGALAAGGPGGSTALTLARPVQAGQPLTAADLTSTHLTGQGVHAFAGSAASELIGRTLLVSAPAGTLLSNALLATASTPTSGQLVLAAAVKPGAFPPTLQVGQWVSVLHVPTGSDPTAVAAVLVARARVVDVRTDTATGITVVSLLIDQAHALPVAQAAAANSLTLAELPSSS